MLKLTLACEGFELQSIDRPDGPVLLIAGAGSMPDHHTLLQALNQVLDRDRVLMAIPDLDPIPPLDSYVFKDYYCSSSLSYSYKLSNIRSTHWSTHSLSPAEQSKRYFLHLTKVGKKIEPISGFAVKSTNRVRNVLHIRQPCWRAGRWRSITFGRGRQSC
jgi:hypothetical protein